MRIIKSIIAALTMSISTPIVIATTAQALEYGNPAPENPQSRAVASLKIGKTGSFGDCTGTLIDPQWIVTARHCLEATKNQGSQARFGQGNNTEIYNVDSWALSPKIDIGLIHLEHKVNNITPAKLLSTLPNDGDIGQFYGWSSSSPLARKNILPTGEWKVKGSIGFSRSAVSEKDVEKPQSGVNTSQQGHATVSSTTPPNDKLPGEMVAHQASSADDSSPNSPENDATNTQGALLELQSTNKAAVQGGDSGGPFFINGKLAGVLTAGTGELDVNTPSRRIFLTPVVSALHWINQIISGQDKDSILTPETAPDPLPTQQASQPYVKKTLIGSVLIILAVGIIVRLKRKTEHSEDHFFAK